MRRVVFLLCLLSSLLLSFQAQANPANCDGDLPQDKAELLELASGLNPLIWGTVSLLKTCEQVKKFIANLGFSRSSTSLSNAQVESALGSMGHSLPGTPTGPKRAVIGTLAQAEAKRGELLRKDRELAANLVPICKSITSAQTCEGRLLAIESLRDDVARWNRDPELMAFIPSVTLDSPDLIAQTGWERGAGGGWYNRAGNKADREVCPELTNLINGLVANAPARARERLPEFRSSCAERDPSYAEWLRRWETQLAGVSKAGTKGGAYVRPEDCERLSRQIDADLRARPREEPPSLSFFEVECAGDASGKYAGQVASWKQAIASRKGAEALNQWDGGIRQAEVEQRKAKEEEERRRVAAQKSAEAERQRLAAQSDMNSTKPAVAQGATSSASRYSSVCVRNGRKLEQVMQRSGHKVYPSGGRFWLKVKRFSIQSMAPCASQDPEAKRLMEGSQDELRQREKMCSEWNRGRGCEEWGEPEYQVENRAWYQVFEREAQAILSDPNGYSADLDGQVNRQAARQSGSMSTQECEARKQLVIATKVPPNASVTAAMETVMFMTKTVLDMIDGGCPTEPGVTPAQVAAERKERQQQYATAEQNCNAVQSGGRRCVPQAHTAAAAVSKPPVASAGQSEQRQRVISYDPVTGRCIGDREMCACEPGIGSQNYGECPSSRRSSGGGIRTAR